MRTGLRKDILERQGRGLDPDSVGGELRAGAEPRLYALQGREYHKEVSGQLLGHFLDGSRALDTAGYHRPVQRVPSLLHDAGEDGLPVAAFAREGDTLAAGERTEHVGRVRIATDGVSRVDDAAVCDGDGREILEVHICTIHDSTVI